MLSSPLRDERTTANPFSTPRSFVMLAASQASRSKSHAGTNMTAASRAPKPRPRLAKCMSLQIATPYRTPSMSFTGNSDPDTNSRSGGAMKCLR